MSSLQGKTISRTYQRLIQTDSEVTDSSLKQVSTGSGTPTSLKVSTTSAEVLKLGINTGGATPDGLLHVLSGSAGSVTASSFANQLTLENSGDSGLSILSGASNFGHIYFGDANDNDVGGISYDHSNDSMNFTVDSFQSMSLDKSGNLTIGGTLSESEDRYTLIENFNEIPYHDIGHPDSEVTQSTSGTTTVTNNTKYTRITTATIDLAASDSVEFAFNSQMIEQNSHVLAYFVNSSGAIADNAMLDIMVHDVQDSTCKIRLSTNAVDIASQTYLIHVTVDPHIPSNYNWVRGGINSEGPYRIAYSEGGIELSTLNSDNDQTLITPRNSNNSIFDGGFHAAYQGISSWESNFTDPSSNETTLKVPITTGTSDDITNVAICAGWKRKPISGDFNEDYATDISQAYFLYATNDDFGTLTNHTNLHFVHSTGGVDYVTNLGITIEAATNYNLEIKFDENKKVSAFVNGVQYGLTNTPTTTTAGGVTEPNSTQKSISGDVTGQLPVVCVTTLSATSKKLKVHFIKASRKF